MLRLTMFPVQITFHGMEPSDAVEGKIRERIHKIERLSPRIVGCRVVVEEPNRVHLNVRLPGTMLSVTKGEAKDREVQDLQTVLRDAFDAAERALREFSSRRSRVSRPAA